MKAGIEEARAVAITTSIAAQKGIISRERNALLHLTGIA
jgi:hypothetical protein